MPKEMQFLSELRKFNTEIFREFAKLPNSVKRKISKHKTGRNWGYPKSYGSSAFRVVDFYDRFHVILGAKK